MNNTRETASPNASSNVTDISITKPDRPCDTCRKRKSKCVIKPGSAKCILCEFHQQSCTFEELPTPRAKRKAGLPTAETTQNSKRRSLSDRTRYIDHLAAGSSTVRDYAELQGDSLLKTTLGLQNHRYALHLGSSAQHDSTILSLRPYDLARAENTTEEGSFRKVASNVYFEQFTDAESPNHESDVEVLDAIEALVSPHGEALIKLYFRIVHPSFPILHKKVYLEKYARSHREFIPPLLAAVYISALNWWSYSSELDGEQKPDIEELEAIAYHSLKSSSSRPKLSTIQAGLLLLQNPTQKSVWQLTAQLVAIGQDLGLHRDCTNWHIPHWERGLRKRIAWALYMQSTWSSLTCGRPLQFPPTTHDWAVQTVTSDDFPESAADEDDEDGSTEVEKGRSLFSAMINLTKILALILHGLYSTRAESEIMSAFNRTKFVLDKVKDLQLRLRRWYAELPDSLRMSTNTKIGKLSSIGWLHTSYFACEMTLHRAVLHSLSSNTDPYLIQVCRSAAKERLTGAINLFNQLRPDHLQSFWYFASSFNLALTGIFAALCMATSSNEDEATYYQQQLQGYRWRLRVSSKSVDFLEAAVQILEGSVGSMLKRTERKKSDGTTQAFMVPLSPAVANNMSGATPPVIMAGFEDYNPDPAADMFLMEGGNERSYFGFEVEM